jgi:NADPH-dependent 2,4-dienoyl-CoA reductase/sulfur reductase-like enzyme
VKRIAGCAALEPGYDVVVVGAGPAGMGAAASAAELGASVLLVDEGDDPGGQIYRAIDRTPVTDVEILGPDYWKGRSIVERFAASACSYLPKASVWHLDGDCVVGIVAEGAARLIRARRVILATGAIERPFPLVGWTLPGVMTVGAAQILLKTAAAVPRGRTVLVGTGPLLWLYASQCIKAGERPTILDTSPAGNRLRALRFAPAFLASPYVRKGLQLLRDVRAGARVISGVNPLSIEAGERESQVLRIKYERGGAQHTLEADQVLLHQGVVPNVNLANAAGCARCGLRRRSWRRHTCAKACSSCATCGRVRGSFPA